MKKIFLSILALCACIGSINAKPEVYFKETFDSGQGDFTINNISMDNGVTSVWVVGKVNDTKYMKASAYKSGPHAAESWLISPAINLSNATSAILTFDHAARYQLGNLADEFQIMIAQNPSSTFNAAEWTNVPIPTMPPAGDWTFVSSGNIDLSNYIGKANIRVAFRYVSSSNAADTWRINNVKIENTENNTLEEGDAKGCYEYGNAFYVYNNDGTTVGYAIEDVDSISFGTNIVDGHECVDLGLSVKWANNNVDGLYAWGEIIRKSYKSADKYKWYQCIEMGNNICVNYEILKYNYDDGLSTLEHADDVAEVKWGGNWRMPTKDEWQELKDSCTWTKVPSGSGYIVKAKNGNFIFLPVTYYWSSSTEDLWSTCEYNSTAKSFAFTVNFTTGERCIKRMEREESLCIRPVYSEDFDITIVKSENGKVSVDRPFAPAGRTITLTISPDPGYKLQSLNVTCGDEEVKITDNSFVMPEGEVKISASFVKMQYKVTVIVTGNGTATASADTAQIGDKITVSYAPGYSYLLHFINIVQGGSKIEFSDSSFIMPAGDVEVLVSFSSTKRLSGAFRVSSSKRVKFSPGNLQYLLYSQTWAFAANQYEMLGEENVEDSDLADRIDLFGFSSPNAKVAPWGISTSTNSNKYSSSGFEDWGKNIGNGNLWRTLTSSEWDYILNSRENASNLKGIARINLNDDGTQYVNGLILLPDNWTLPSGVTFKSGLSSTRSTQAYSDYQTITLANWQKMEAAGAVFLPATGYRNGILVEDSEYIGTYWSATRYNNSTVYYLNFHSDEAKTSIYHSYFGRAVRLVQDY